MRITINYTLRDAYTLTYDTNNNDSVVIQRPIESDNPVTLPYVYPKTIEMEGFSSSAGYDGQYTYNASKDGWAKSSGYTHIRLGRIVTSEQVSDFNARDVSKNSPLINNLNGGIMGRWYVWGGTENHVVYWDPDSTTINDITLLKFGDRQITITTSFSQIFLGWSTSSNGSTDIGVAGSQYTITQDDTYHARDPYTVTLNAGTGGSVSPSIYSETDYPLGFSLPLPTFSGKIFLGWSTSNDISDSVGTDGDTYAITSTQTLYALWKTNI